MIAGIEVEYIDRIGNDAGQIEFGQHTSALVRLDIAEQAAGIAVAVLLNECDAVEIAETKVINLFCHDRYSRIGIDRPEV